MRGTAPPVQALEAAADVLCHVASTNWAQKTSSLYLLPPAGHDTPSVFPPGSPVVPGRVTGHTAVSKAPGGHLSVKAWPALMSHQKSQ